MRYRFIGHNYDPAENHDKIWGAICLDGPEVFPGRVVTVWGRRGKKLQTKMVTDDWDLTRLIMAKKNKGYKEISKDRLDEVYPEFEDDLEKTAFWAALKA